MRGLIEIFHGSGWKWKEKLKFWCPLFGRGYSESASCGGWLGNVPAQRPHDICGLISLLIAVFGPGLVAGVCGGDLRYISGEDVRFRHPSLRQTMQQSKSDH